MIEAGSIAGVDGCRAGWVAVFLPAGGGAAEAKAEVVPRFAGILEHSLTPGIVAVDIPIGLPERIGPEGRGPEKAARAALGKRKSSVFPVPSRATFLVEDYWQACDVAFSTSEPARRISKQLFGLSPKIREVDAVMRPELEAVVFETHPELAFWKLNGEREMAASKKTAPGLAERRALLMRHGYSEAFLQAVPPGARADDLLDAAACALIARRIFRGEAVPFPDPPQRDARGLRMAIWA